MKLLMKLITVFVGMLMLVSAMGTAVSAEERTYLSKKSVTLEVGETASIKLANAKGKIVWKISDSDVFKYSNGVITAVGEGKATLTAINNNRKYKCTVTVKAKGSAEEAAPNAVITVREGEKKLFVFQQMYPSMKLSVKGSEYAKLVKGDSEKGFFTVWVTGKKEGTARFYIKNKNNTSQQVIIDIIVADANAPVSVGDSGTQNNAAANTSKDTAVSQADYIDEVIRIVNEERAAAGLSPLEKSDTLCSNAAVRADEVAQYFSHTRPDGSSCFTAVTASYSTCGENIAKGQRTPAQVMNDWMNSSGHRANILNSEFGKIGVGYDSQTNSWVQLFTN